MIIAFFTLALILIVIILLRINFTRNFEEKINTLFSGIENIPTYHFSYSQVEQLPLPVQKYFKYTLRNNQQIIGCVRLKHKGKFKTAPDKPWKDITGEQYFMTGTPGFIWKGKIGPITAQDIYLNEKGKLMVSLFETFTIMSTQGEKIDQGELLRWLGESVWFPTNLLPHDRLKWEPINDKSAKLIFDYKGQSVYYKVIFNKTGQITQLETERFYNGQQLEKWVGNCSEYKEINGYMIPTFMSASWKLSTGDYTYANFQLTNIEYNIPEKYK